MILHFIWPWSLAQWINNFRLTNYNIMIMNTNETNKETCNAMLRGELSAIETYTQAIEKFGTDVGISYLTDIHASHVANEESLRHLAEKCGAEPVTSSGPWGTFATSVEGVATLLGKAATLLALRQGEEHGVNQYEKALEDQSLSQNIRDFIKYTLLPAQTEHLIQLDLCKAVAV